MNFSRLISTSIATLCNVNDECQPSRFPSILQNFKMSELANCKANSTTCYINEQLNTQTTVMFNFRQIVFFLRIPDPPLHSNSDSSSSSCSICCYSSRSVILILNSCQTANNVCQYLMHIFSCSSWKYFFSSCNGISSNFKRNPSSLVYLMKHKPFEKLMSLFS